MRFLLSSAAAVMLLAAPVAASAATTAPAPAASAKPAKPAKHVVKASTKPMHAAKPAARRDSGSAAVDALNEQSLAKAKAGQ